MLPITNLSSRLSTILQSSPSPSYRLLARTVRSDRILLAQRQYTPPRPVSHGTENYFVDDDETPPPDNTLFKVDATSDAAQSAYEPPTGPWSRASTGSEEYRTGSKDVPYDLPGGLDVRLGYGETRKEAAEDKSPRSNED